MTETRDICDMCPDGPKIPTAVVSVEHSPNGDLVPDTKTLDLCVRCAGVMLQDTITLLATVDNRWINRYLANQQRGER